MKENIEQKSLLLKLQDIQYWYPSTGPEKTILNHVNLEINAGEVIHVAGRNGSGKTTLLRLIGGILEPTKGQRLNAKPDLRAFLLDQTASDFVGGSLTILEQIAVGLENRIGLMQSIRQGAIRSEIVDILRHYNVGLEDKLDGFISEISGGQRQIVALLSVLLGKPDLVLLDEFTTFMDPLSESVSINILSRLIDERKIAVVYVTHSKLNDMKCDWTFEL